ncbi:hypothetical protein IJ750_07455 [bacterium]|nr:hypothetical protein [bacterium]
MDLFKALTGKSPAEYEQAAKILVDTPDIDLYKKLVNQDDFLFDFVKNNVAKRIQSACNKENYLNLIKFFDYYSASYDTVIAEVLYQYGGMNLFEVMKDMFLNGSDEKKAYSAKFLSFLSGDILSELLPEIRKNAHSEYEPLAANSIEILSNLGDEISKSNAIKNLEAEDEFEQYDAIKFLVAFGAKDQLGKIIDVMKKSSLSENIAAEIPYLVPLDEILKSDFDNGILILCNIVNAIPEIIPAAAAIDYSLFELFEDLYCSNLTSTSALLLRLAKDKFESLSENDEYLFDCDKNTKDEVRAVSRLLAGVNVNKLNSLLYEELYDESDFVFYAVDYVDDVEELETLLDSKNQTLVLKVLTILKEKQALTASHKQLALSNITNNEIKQVVEVL